MGWYSDADAAARLGPHAAHTQMEHWRVLGHHAGRVGHRLASRLGALWTFLRGSWIRLLACVLALAYVLAIFVLPLEQVTATRWGVFVQLLSAVTLATTFAQFLGSTPYARLEQEDDGRDALDSALYDLQAGEIIGDSTRAAAVSPVTSSDEGPIVT